eukprot:439074-Amphidinium_carterae.1
MPCTSSVKLGACYAAVVWAFKASGPRLADPGPRRPDASQHSFFRRKKAHNGILAARTRSCCSSIGYGYCEKPLHLQRSNPDQAVVWFPAYTGKSQEQGRRSSFVGDGEQR